MRTKEKFTFNKQQEEYIVKFDNKRFPWWIFLLLLLLLLFIPISESISFKVVEKESMNPIPDAKVNIEYAISDVNYNRDMLTDKDGLVTFEFDSYFIYEMIYKPSFNKIIVTTEASKSGFKNKFFNEKFGVLNSETKLIKLK